MSGPVVDKPDIASIRLCSNFIPVAEKPKNDKKLKILKQKEEEKKLEAALLNKQMNEIVDVSFEDVFIDIFKREGSYQQIRLDFSKLDLGGKIYDSFWLNLMIDYASKSSKQNLLDLLRIQISADEMVPDNILAELKKCKSIQWKITNEGIRLHYLIGNEAELNPCILKNMYPSKRNFLGSIANALRAQLRMAFLRVKA